MIRTLLISSVLALLAAGGAQAGGLVPGSDTSVRARDTHETFTVVQGASASGVTSSVRETRSFGYPLNGGQSRIVPGSEFFDEAGSDADTNAVTRGLGGDRVIAPTSRSLIVPGSDSF